MEWVGLAAAVAGLLGLVIKWLDRRTKEQELLDAIHEGKRVVEKALDREDYHALAAGSRVLLDDLHTLLRKRASKVSGGK